MRFTTLSTLTNAFVTSAIALLSLIPATNAAPGRVFLEFTLPDAGETFYNGTIGNARWYVLKWGKPGGKP
jgi:hypothetical protein